MALLPRMNITRSSDENKAIGSNSRALRGSLPSVHTAALSMAMQMAEAVIVQVFSTTKVVMPAPLADPKHCVNTTEPKQVVQAKISKDSTASAGCQEGTSDKPTASVPDSVYDSVDSQATDIELYGVDIVSGWNDIDANDSNDLLQASEYVDNTIGYLCERELVTMPNHTYMDRQKDLTWRMRRELVDWMVQIHYQLCLLPEALFLVRMALFRMCLIEDKHWPRGEVAMSTTMLLTSTAFRQMDKGDVMDTISRLVVEYYGK
ncbi:G2/mitotic-specific cyclin [Coemansia sp. S155-1]|nr:G2/mitotic-specific cyclin [Coemansia sp. S155-1]